MDLIDNTPTGRLITNILLAFAKYERNMIIERTQAGKDKKKKGFAVDLILHHHETYREVSELTGMSNSTLIRVVNAHRGKHAFEEKIRLVYSK